MIILPKALIIRLQDRPQPFWSLDISVLSADLLEELHSLRVSFLKQLHFFSFFIQVLAL